MPSFTFFLFVLHFIILLPSVSSATAWNSERIEAFAKKQLEEKITPPVNGKLAINIAKIDPRVIIKPCLTPLTANIPENTSRRNVNIKIICADSTPWQLYLTAKIERTFAVIVAINTIEKGVTLSENNIGIRYMETNKTSGQKLSDIKMVLGSKAKKRIGKNRLITQKNVCLICKGDAVTIIAKNQNFIVKTKGIALSSGNIHQQIRVKNTRSGRIITPKISAVNQVTIHL